VVAFTSKDVARAAGVSQSTVSYVMSGKRPISERTRQRVLSAIEQLTYEPNAGARALASQRTRVIGLVVPFGSGSDTTGLLPFIETIAGAARAEDHEVLLVTADEGSAGLRRLAGRSLCDGIVLMDILTRDERVPVAASLRIPVILIGVPQDPAGLRCVDVDFPAAARLAVDELVATGHDRVAVMDYPREMVERNLNFVPRFLDAAHTAADGHGLRQALISPLETDRQSVQDAVDRALAFGAGGRLGIVIPSVQVLQRMLHALRVRGLKPGREVSVIALCTDATAQESEPPVTNVSLEPRDVSRRAMKTLFWLLDPTPGASPPMVDLVAPRLTRRGTVIDGDARPARRPTAGATVSTP
jgi:DNA-binding LacI/PurR family transcriptional regulator